jgi:phosphotransferase system enzyme I (PtsI)
MTTSEIIVTGIGVGRGLVVGDVRRMPDPLPEPAQTTSTRTAEDEIVRATQALGETAADLRARGVQAGGVAKEVLDALALMADDPMLLADVQDRIERGSTAERSVFDAFAGFASIMQAAGGYMAERAGDLGDVANRVIARIMGVSAPGVPQSTTPFILVARDLAPADTALLDFDIVRALVTTDGGPTSHTAILAREKGLPAIVGATGAEVLVDGDVVIVDASTGDIVLHPSAARIDEALLEAESRQAAREGATGPGRMADGHEVALLANVGSSSSASAAVDAQAEGVGLFRTEFLFLDNDTAPSIEEQRVEYSAVFDKFPGQKVVVRVLDAGADKPLSFLTDEGEENPALGRRGIRALLAHEDILRDQLTAIAQATATTSADVWVMAPMISTVEETEAFVGICREVGITKPGVMIEVPSSALLADHILDVADFVSIGTNDLTQYTFAADRLLGTVANLQDAWNPAVLRLIREVGLAGERTKKPVGICGEAAADPVLAVVLIGLGVTSLSMSPTALADVRAEISRFTLAEARQLAERALSARNAKDARAAASLAFTH